MKRFYTLILILVLMFAFTAPAFAQDMACGDLAAEDCELLYASAEAMADVTSGSQFVGLEAQVLNVPQTPFEELAFDFSLDTSYSYSDEAAAAAMGLQDMDAMALAELYGDPDELSSTVTTILEGTSAAINMTANFSNELAALLTQTPDMAFPESVSLNLVMDGGVVYLDLSTLESLMADSGMGMGGMSGWIGVNILPLVQQSLMQSVEQQGMMMVPASNTGAGPLFTQLAAADPSGTITQFLNIERVDGEEGSATFVTSVDWDAFVESPYFEQLIASALMQNAATTGAMPNQAEIDQMVTLGRMFGPALLEGITLELTESIDLESNYLTATDFTFDWDLSDLQALSTMAGGAAIEIEEDAVVYLNVVTENTALNEDVTVEVPADAFVLPAEMLNQMMSGGMQ